MIKKKCFDRIERSGVMGASNFSMHLYRGNRLSIMILKVVEVLCHKFKVMVYWKLEAIS